MTADPRRPCPDCGVLVDHLEDLEPDAPARRDGLRIARPCGHVVVIVNVLPGGALELAVAPPEGLLGDPPPAPDAAAAELRAAVEERIDADVAGGFPPGLRDMARGMLGALVPAMTDAAVLGTGWIRLTRPDSSSEPFALERVDPARVIVSDQ